MSNIEAQLRAELDIERRFTELFDLAIQIFRELLIGSNGFGIPYDTGNLAEGIQAESVDSSGFTANFVSTARSENGFDYPLALNEVSVFNIVPVRARALAFSVGGETVFAQRVSYANTHIGWWDRYVNNQELWDEAVNRAAAQGGLL